MEGYVASLGSLQQWEDNILASTVSTSRSAHTFSVASITVNEPVGFYSLLRRQLQNSLSSWGMRLSILPYPIR